MNIPNWLRKVLGLPDPTLVHPDVADLQAQLAAANATAAANRTHAIDATRRLEGSIPADVHLAIVAAAAPAAQPPVTNSAGTWTIGAGNVVLLNNAPAAGGLGTRIKKVRSDTIVVLGTDGNWWEWTGTGYINVGPNEPLSPGADVSSTNTATPLTPPTATAAANGAGTVIQPEETAVGFALRNGLDVPRFVQFSNTMPGGMTWTEMLPAFAKWNPPAARAPAMPPIGPADVLRDVLATRATSNWGAPFAQRALSALGASFQWYVNAYGAGGDYFDVAAQTGALIYDANKKAYAIGGMAPDDFAAIKPELAAIGVSLA